MAIARRPNRRGTAFRLEGDAGPSAPGTGPVRWSISPAQAQRLTALAQGKEVLEIGTGTGLSTEALANGAAYVATFDVDDEVRRLVWPNLPANVTAYDRRYEGLHQAGLAFDLIFQDGLHTLDGVRKDIEEALPLMRPDAIWVFHDSQMESVERAVFQGPTKFRLLERFNDKGPTSMVIVEIDRR